LRGIIDAWDRLGEVAWSNGLHLAHGAYGPGISDAGLFHMNRLKGNEVFLRAKKNGGEVRAYIPDWLQIGSMHGQRGLGFVRSSSVIPIGRDPVIIT
jgi:hypothetical protein